MRAYNKICPFCGAENKNLLLEETHGWMECSKCLRITQILHVQDAASNESDFTPVYQTDSGHLTVLAS